VVQKRNVERKKKLKLKEKEKAYGVASGRCSSWHLRRQAGKRKEGAIWTGGSGWRLSCEEKVVEGGSLWEQEEGRRKRGGGVLSGKRSGQRRERHEGEG